MGPVPQTVRAGGVSDPVRRRILSILCRGPSTRSRLVTKIYKLGAHAPDLNAALAPLIEGGVVAVRVERTRGRPRTTYDLAV
jgi:DNA-binding transcriptional ArsR family regulator